MVRDILDWLASTVVATFGALGVVAVAGDFLSRDGFDANPGWLVLLVALSCLWMVGRAWRGWRQ